MLHLHYIFRLLSEDHRSCDSVRVFLETVRFDYVHLTNLNIGSGSLLYSTDSTPQFASIIYCSFNTFKNVSSIETFKSDLDQYSKKYSIGQILIPTDDDDGLNVTGLSSTIAPLPRDVSYFIGDASILRTTKKTDNPIKFSISTNVHIFHTDEAINAESIGQILFQGEWKTVSLHTCSTVNQLIFIFCQTKIEFYPRDVLFKSVLQYHFRKLNLIISFLDLLG